MILKELKMSGEVTYITSIVKYLMSVSESSFVDSFSCIRSSDSLYIGLSTEDTSIIDMCKSDILECSLDTSNIFMIVNQLVAMGYDVSVWDGLRFVLFSFNIVNEDNFLPETSKVTVSNLDNFYGFSSGICLRISGLSAEILDNVVKDILWFRNGIGSFYSCEYGSVLLNPKEKGKIYVNGILERTLSDFNYSWNINSDRYNLSIEDILIGIKKVYNGISTKNKSNIKNCFEVHLSNRR